MPRRARFIAVAAGVAFVVLAARFCHSSVLWADDNLPLAAAMQVALGKTLYRDVWFDKPPLVAWIDLLWGARSGLWLRFAGATYVLAVAGMAWKLARTKWTEREGLLAALFAALFLTFDLPSAVIPLASDMLLILPHLAAIYFAWRERPFWSGVAAGIGLLCSSKAVFVLAACALWQWRALPMLAAGFALPNAIAIGWMAAHGSARDYYRQVWQWGSIYASNTFVENPLVEGAKRTADWAGFHAALAVGCILYIWRERKWRVAAWIAIAFVGVVLGLRFFPRYYFLLLPPTIIAAARGWALTKRAGALALFVLTRRFPWFDSRRAMLRSRGEGPGATSIWIATAGRRRRSFACSRGPAIRCSFGGFDRIFSLTRGFQRGRDFSKASRFRECWRIDTCSKARRSRRILSRRIGRHLS